MLYDVIIVGGGPAGLSAALALGRARKQVLLCDAGSPRNAAADHLNNFVTRDGIPPGEFRDIARQQLQKYPNVEIRSVSIASIAGERGAFLVGVASKTDAAAETMATRRVLLCTGMVDDLPSLEGLRELWGYAVYQCPYCHGWEVQDRQWGYLALSVRSLGFALQLRGWTRDVTVFISGDVSVPTDISAQFRDAGVRLETRAIARLIARKRRLDGIELTDGTLVPCETLFMHPPQSQAEVVRRLGLALDDMGFVQVDPVTRETSVPGIYAGGDLTTQIQGAMMAAAAGALAAGMLNHELTLALAMAGELP